MNSENAANSPPGNEDTSGTIVYDPSDPFWRDDENDDDNDDDMDFVPEEIADDSGDSEEEYVSFHDAAERLGDFDGVEIAFEYTDDNDEEAEDRQTEEDETEDDSTAQPRPIFITREQIMQLLGNAGLGRPPVRTNGPSGRAAFEKVPSEQGRELMNNGTFGSNVRKADSINRRKRLAYDVMWRELGLGSDGRYKSTNRLMKQDMIPESIADTIIHYPEPCYSGQFSDDGNFFFSCARDFKVRMYDTSNPYDWKYYKSVVYPYGQWTITDASLSPENRFLAYSSLRNVVCLAPTDPDNESEPSLLDFADMGNRIPRGFHPYFSIMSLRFSGDGREIVAGTGDHSVYIYDIERRQSILRIPGHRADVNAVCFGDSQSPHILYSGSDDTTLKVWDRRSMGDGREAGVFLGHTEGLTYVDSKGDGRYVLSNGKDQTAKLWDLRKMMSKEKADGINTSAYTTNFEYRSNGYDDENYYPHPHDCSLVTFRGHKVLKTLIRCHFSPPGSTDSRYVYSGSYDGSIYIWNLDATLAGKINVLEATKNSRPRDPNLYLRTFHSWGRNLNSWMTCVRDASWHPHVPIIAAASLNGWGACQGTCTVHSWNDGVEEDEAEPKIGRRVNALLQHDEQLYEIPEG